MNLRYCQGRALNGGRNDSLLDYFTSSLEDKFSDASCNDFDMKACIPDLETRNKICSAFFLKHRTDPYRALDLPQQYRSPAQDSGPIAVSLILRSSVCSFTSYINFLTPPLKYPSKRSPYSL